MRTTYGHARKPLRPGTEMVLVVPYGIGERSPFGNWDGGRSTKHVLNCRIDQAAGGPLATALLVPRHRDIGIQDLWQGRTPKPVSVFVCRFRGEPHELSGELTSNDVSIVFWGLVNDALDSGR